MKSRYKRKLLGDNKGMTLVEVIVSMALLGIVAAMAMMVLTSSLLLSMRAGDNMRQTGFAGADMDEMLVTPTGESASAVVYFKQNPALASEEIDGWFITTEAAGNMSDARMNSFVPIEDE